MRDPNIGLGAGVVGILILLVNRFTINEITDIQSRADIISVLSCSALLLNALSNQDIEAREREQVPLVGYAVGKCLVDDLLPPIVQDTLSKGCDSILKHSPCKSVFVLWDGKVVARGGVLGSSTDLKSTTFDIERMPILRESISSRTEVYLPDLQVECRKKHQVLISAS